MAAENVVSSANELRENLVTTAVKFLTNPSVQKCTMESKERFLRNKGLSEVEIQRAFEKGAELINFPSIGSELMFFQHSRHSWFKEHVLPLILYGGCAYGLYWFYKNCISQILFVEHPKKKSTAECLEELRKTMEALNSNICALRSEVQGAGEQQASGRSLRAQLDNLKSDLASVKGILLNRNQFPSIKTRTEPPSIPVWQRQSEEATSSQAAPADPAPASTGAHRRSQRSQSGGSNSSEGEQATKNSDSSLEIIS